jgi:hypothetical protein
MFELDLNSQCMMAELASLTAHLDVVHPGQATALVYG